MSGLDRIVEDQLDDVGIDERGERAEDDEYGADQVRTAFGPEKAADAAHLWLQRHATFRTAARCESADTRSCRRCRSSASRGSTGRRPAGTNRARCRRGRPATAAS